MTKQYEIVFGFVGRDIPLDFSYSLGVGYIQAYLKSYNINSAQFIREPTYSASRVAEEMVELNTPVIGFTCYRSNYPRIITICREIKKIEKDILIVVGGPSPSFADDIILDDCHDIDLCVRGEGEYTVHELLCALRENKSISDIWGITFRNKGKLVRTPDRDPIRGDDIGAELDILPSPLISGIIPPEAILHRGGMGILTSRGCPYKCIYCIFSLMGRQTVRFHSVDRVVTELAILEEAASRRGEKCRIYIHDDAFTLNPSRAKTICHKIIDAGFSHLNLWMETRADRLDHELIDLLHQAGVTQFSIGLESAVPRLLNTIQKVRPAQNGKKDNFTAERAYLESVRDAVRYGMSLGINVELSMLQGLPGESIADVQKTITFIKSLGVTTVYQNSLNVYPGTELFKHAKRYGLKVSRVGKGSVDYEITNPPRSAKYPPAFLGGKAEKLRDDFSMHPGVYRMLSHALCPANASASHEIVIMGSKKRLPSLLSWLRNELGDRTSFSLLVDKHSLANVARYDALFKKYGFGAHEIQYVESIHDKARLPGAQYFMVRKYEEWGYNLLDYSLRVLLLPLSLYTQSQKLVSRMRKPLGPIVFSVDKQADLKELGRLADLLNSKGAAAIKRSLLIHMPAIEDECRWQDLPCPATCVSKMIVKGDGSILPCLHGKSIGRVGERVESICSRVRSLMEKEMALRGCHTCEVRENCSKCLFPYPLTRREYCAFRKSHPNVHRIVTMFKIPRSATVVPELIVEPRGVRFVDPKPSMGRQKKLALKEIPSYVRGLIYTILRMRNDLLLFRWGSWECLGIRRHSCYAYHKPPLAIWLLSSFHFDALQSLLSGRDVNDAIYLFIAAFGRRKLVGVEMVEFLELIEKSYRSSPSHGVASMVYDENI